MHLVFSRGLLLQNVSGYIFRIAILFSVFLHVGCTPVDVVPVVPVAQENTKIRPSNSDEEFLEDLGYRSFRYFVETAHPVTGLISDGAAADGSKPGDISSIAATGFGLTAFCIGAERGWIDYDEALDQVKKTLLFLKKMPGRHRGFYYHFVEHSTGERAWESELSSIDTALLSAGIITCRQYFDNEEIRQVADQLLEDIEWPWMLNGGETFSMGWKPESGFIKYRWDHFSEHTMMQFLAIASNTHPVTPDHWHHWHRDKVINWQGRTFMQFPPLFIHQFSHAWVDFRNRRDAWADYWNNSTQATLAHEHFLRTYSEFPHYKEGVWGLTASLSPQGYSAWGGPPASPAYPVDGTVVPCAPAGSLPFTPERSLATLMKMQDQYRDKIWGRYGFIDAFNPATGWVADRVLGIDIGITLLMAENHRSEFVWEQFMSYEPIQQAMVESGFISTDKHMDEVDREYLSDLAQDTWNSIDKMVHSDTGLPYDSSQSNEFTSVSNIGIYLTSLGIAREFGWLSHDEALARCERALSSIKKLPTWFGFRQSWNSVIDLKGSPADPWVSVLDSGNLAAGLITASSAFPEMRTEFLDLFEQMNWTSFYDQPKEALLGGFDPVADKHKMDWHLSDLGSDSRMALFLAVASGKAPLSTWENLNREWETKYHLQYLKPGWQGGGLFMHYITGLWLDEEHTLMGQSAENFAMAQIEHGRQNKYPVWGWSASQSPSGEYLGWGALRDEVVTPHASILALGHFPKAVIENLKTLESMGVRSPKQGFYDSVNIKTGEVGEEFLILDQGMILLTLANVLKDNVVRNWFESYEPVRLAKEKIPDYHTPAFGPKNSLKFPTYSLPDLSTKESREAIIGEDEQRAVWNSVYLSGHKIADFKVWREDQLVVNMRVFDDTPYVSIVPDKLNTGDSIELFIDPQVDGLRWGNPADFQYGISRSGLVWEWFGERLPPKPDVVEFDGGYELKIFLPWELFSENKEHDNPLGFSVAISNRESETELWKTEWFWREENGKIQLGLLKAGEPSI